MAQRGGDGRTNKQTENLPILQDKTKEKVEQGKGTAEHLMPLGYLFLNLLESLFKAGTDFVPYDDAKVGAVFMKGNLRRHGGTTDFF